MDDQPYLEIRHLTKKFGDFTALADVSLSVERGAFVCFLGPSGCGKTTLLRAIAGLELQTAGQILQDGRDISQLPPSARDFGIVFQSYALFPNLTVEANIGYGLVNQGLPKAEIRKRVGELLDLVHLPGAGRKYPAALSGGEQQRVALARALAMQPGLLLLDEPLSALDAKVRVGLRHEIKELQRKLGVTTIMVTHDQEEALTVADRVVVMSKGVIEQVGTPADIYSKPASAFVADFVGRMNVLRGEVNDATSVRIGNSTLTVEPVAIGGQTGDILISFRPEDVIFRHIAEDEKNRFEGRVRKIEFLGAFSRATIDVADFGGALFEVDFSANLLRDFALTEGAKVNFALPVSHLRLYPATSRGPAANGR